MKFRPCTANISMNTPRPDKDINSNELPEEKVFTSKEVFQYKQPADTGKALTSNDERSSNTTGNDAQKSSKEEGLNAAKSTGNAGAFEGFENQSNEA